MKRSNPQGEKRSNFCNVLEIVMSALLVAIMCIMSWTPLGYLNIGPLAITLNVIPLAIAAIVLGPKGGALIGAVFGITSFLQCVGIGGTSGMGVICFGINPILAFIQRFVPRLLVGYIVGIIYKYVRKHTNKTLSCAVAGFFAAFLNTALFMSALILLFGNTDYIKELVGGRNIIVFICSYVGINAVFEMIASTIVTAAVGRALISSRSFETLNE